MPTVLTARFVESLLDNEFHATANNNNTVRMKEDGSSTAAAASGSFRKYDDDNATTRRLDEYYAYALTDDHYLASSTIPSSQQQHPVMQVMLLGILGILVVASVVVFLVRCRRAYKAQPTIELEDGDHESGLVVTNNPKDKALKLLNQYHAGGVGGAVVVEENNSDKGSGSGAVAIWRSGVVTNSHSFSTLQTDNESYYSPADLAARAHDGNENDNSNPYITMT
ncbi:MAG: hypothetical protein SGARI_004025 [Bacillariaceae sp.]